MISEIRTYFKDTIAEVDSDLRQHKEYFTSANISDTKLEDTYFLQIGNLSSDYEDSSVNGSFAVLLEIYKNGNKDIIERVDDAYCKAIEIQAKLMNQNRVDQLSYMKSVVGLSIDPTPVENNDNLAKFSLQFTVMVKYNAI
jgi:hypothetical protein